MKTHLLFPDREFDFTESIPNKDDLIFDLELDIILNIMAGGDDFIHDISRAVLTKSLTDVKEIEYRQTILKDFLKNRDFFFDLYGLISRTIDYRTNMSLLFKPTRANGVLRDSIKVLNSFIDCLVEMRLRFSKKRGSFDSEGIVNLISLTERLASDNYVKRIKSGLNTLRYREGVKCSMKLSEKLYFSEPCLTPGKRVDSRLSQRAGKIFKKEYTLRIAEQNDHDKRELSLLKDLALSRVAGVMEEARDHILSFFFNLQSEMAFYLGSLNLYSRMEELFLDISFPQVFPVASEEGEFIEDSDGLYDLALAIQMEQGVVGNEISATGKRLIVITGANQGGKTTYLRSRGQVQLMMQAGMFVAAKSCRLHCVAGLFTHFKREEDHLGTEGRLAEELKRMNDIVEWVNPGGMVICNESFSSTNEVEATRINMGITNALLVSRVKVLHVTHLFLFVDELQNLEEKDLKETLFLRASREEDGSRSFKLKVNPPLRTGYAQDIYRDIFK